MYISIEFRRVPLEFRRIQPTPRRLPRGAIGKCSARLYSSFLFDSRSLPLELVFAPEVDEEILQRL